MEPNPVSSHPLSGVHASDQEGLICGFLFEASGIGRAIELKQALDWLRAPAVRSGFIWLHFNLSNVASERWIRLNLNLPPEFFEALQLDSRSTRIEDASDNLIAVVNDVAFEFSFDPSDIATLWACVNDHVVVSTRRHPLQSIDRLRQAVRQGCRFDSSVSLLNHLMHDQGDVLVRIVRDVTIQVDGIEDKLLGGRLQSQRADLGRLRRVLVRLQRLLAPEPAALFRLLKQPPPWVSPADLDELRQSTEEFSLVLRDLMGS